MTGSAGHDADGVDEFAHVLLDGLVDALDALFGDADQFGVALLGGAFPLVGACEPVVELVGAFAYLPIVHATESNAWLVVCLSGRKLVKGAH